MTQPSTLNLQPLGTQRVAPLYKRMAQPDEQLLNLLEAELTRLGFQVFIDRHLTIGVEWAKEIERQVRAADAVIPLISEAAIHSEMLAYEVQCAHDAAQKRGGAPRLLPVRVQYEGPLPEPLAAILNPKMYALWQGARDNQRLVEELVRALRSPVSAPEDPPPPVAPSLSPLELEPVGGAVPLNSKFYVVRSTDAEFLSAIAFDTPIVWGLDEVDRLFTCDFSSEVFGLFRSWHNERALDPSGPWSRLTLVIAYATEAHLFITDLNQSPFNVGTRLSLHDFTLEQVADLNRRYGSPLRDEAEVSRYFQLVGGHPYPVRRGLYQMVTHGLSIADFEGVADHDEGPFGDHLRRLLVSLSQDEELLNVARGVLGGQSCPTPESFYRFPSPSPFGEGLGEGKGCVSNRATLA